MSVDKAKDTSPKRSNTENKIVEAKPESSTKTENKPDGAPKEQGMGEGQKPVSKAYKDNWNDILGKRKSDSECLLNGRPRRLARSCREGDGGPNLDYDWIPADQSALITKAILLDLDAGGYHIVKKA